MKARPIKRVEVIKKAASIMLGGPAQRPESASLSKNGLVFALVVLQVRLIIRSGLHFRAELNPLTILILRSNSS